jgi:hypothetical protein
LASIQKEGQQLKKREKAAKLPQKKQRYQAISPRVAAPHANPTFLSLND